LENMTVLFPHCTSTRISSAVFLFKKKFWSREWPKIQSERRGVVFFRDCTDCNEILTF
jgi:hypothetical protein